MNWKNGVLVVSVVANVALVLYLVLGTSPVIVTPVYGQQRVASGGGYTMTTADITSSRKALWIIDSTEKRMIVYAFPASRGKNLDGISERDLRKDFGENLAGELLVVQGATSSNTEAVYVVDTVGKKLIAYECRGGKEVEVIGTRDLAKDFRK